MNSVEILLHYNETFEEDLSELPGTDRTPPPPYSIGNYSFPQSNHSSYSPRIAKIMGEFARRQIKVEPGPLWHEKKNQYACRNLPKWFSVWEAYVLSTVSRPSSSHFRSCVAKSIQKIKDNWIWSEWDAFKLRFSREKTFPSREHRRHIARAKKRITVPGSWT